MKLFSVFENIENWPVYDEKSKSAKFLGFGFSAIIPLPFVLLKNAIHFWNPHVNTLRLIYHTGPSASFDFFPFSFVRQNKCKIIVIFAGFFLGEGVSKRQKIKTGWWGSVIYQTKRINMRISKMYSILQQDKWEWNYGWKTKT